MDRRQAQHSTYLFTVRLWVEELGDGESEWRGRAQYAASGETRYFRDWPALIAFLLTTLPKLDGAERAESAVR